MVYGVGLKNNLNRALNQNKSPLFVSLSTENTQKRNKKQDSAMDHYKGNYMAAPIELTPDTAWQKSPSNCRKDF